MLLGFGFGFREFRILIPCPPIPGHATGGSAFPLAHAWSGFLIDCLLVSLQHAQRGSMGQAATSIACARTGGHATPPRGTASAQWDGLGWPVSWVRTRPTVSGHGLCHQPRCAHGECPQGGICPHAMHTALLLLHHWVCRTIPLACAGILLAWFSSCPFFLLVFLLLRTAEPPSHISQH